MGRTALDPAAIALKLQDLPGWESVDDQHLGRTFPFADFARALAFVNRVGAMAEAEDHHPDITLSWGRARVEWWTHDAGGITPKDFACAKLTDRAFTG